MKDIKLFSKCGACKRRKLYVSRGQVTIPTGQTARIKDFLICRACIKELREKLKGNA